MKGRLQGSIPVDLKPGAKAWVKSFHPYLVEGLQHGQEVTITRVQREDVALYVMVRDEVGVEWKLDHWNVDPGGRYLMDGTWYHESEPAVLEVIAEEVEMLGNARWDSAIEEVRRGSIERYEAILRRNRW